MLEAAEPGVLSIVVFPDDTVLSSPTPQAVAERIGLRTQAELDL